MQTHAPLVLPDIVTEKMHEQELKSLYDDAEILLLKEVMTESECIHKVFHAVTSGFFTSKTLSMAFAAAHSLYSDRQKITAARVIDRMAVINGTPTAEQQTLLQTIGTSFTWGESLPSHEQEVSSAIETLEVRFKTERLKAFHDAMPDLLSSYGLEQTVNIMANLAFELKLGEKEEQEPDKMELWDKVSAQILSGRKDLLFETGIDPLDELIGGIRKGSLVTVQAGTGVGKSALAQNLCINYALKGMKCLFVSLEMTHEELMERFISSLTGSVIAEAVHREQRAVFEKLPIWFPHKKTASPQEVESLMDKAKYRLDGLDIVVVDYIQLLDLPETRNKLRHQQLAEASRMLKAKALEQNLIVIILAQVNKDGTARESAGIEHDSNVVLFLQDTPDGHEIVVKKNRMGKTGIAPVLFKKQSTTFTARQHGGYNGQGY